MDSGLYLEDSFRCWSTAFSAQLIFLQSRSQFVPDCPRPKEKPRMEQSVWGFLL